MYRKHAEGVCDDAQEIASSTKQLHTADSSGNSRSELPLHNAAEQLPSDDKISTPTQ